MRKILAIESATDICSIAIGWENGQIVSRQLAEANRHSSGLLPLIEECLQTAGLKPTDLDAVVISDGPGSYTGLRVGLSTVKGLCYALGIPLIAVNTLLSLANQYILLRDTPQASDSSF